MVGKHRLAAVITFFCLCKYYHLALQRFQLYHFMLNNFTTKVRKRVPASPFSDFHLMMLISMCICKEQSHTFRSPLLEDTNTTDSVLTHPSGQNL